MPPSQPSPYRQLGSGGQQPVRVQMVVGLIAGLILVAVPLYLWRKPDDTAKDESSAAVASGSASAARAALPKIIAAPTGPKVRLSPFKSLRCESRGPGKTPPERCDHLTFFEDALTRGLRDTPTCVPETKTGATVSAVMDINFRKKTFKIYRGKSSSLSAAAGKQLFGCIKQGFPKPDWGAIPHQHTRYVVNVVATFPPSNTF